MNFIVRWAMSECGNAVGCASCVKRKCIPRRELSEATGCSERLIDLLQSERGAVTHPKIADRIADYLGATPEERDKIVARKHRGTYTPGCSTPKPISDSSPAWNAKEVVVIGKNGEELDRFKSATCAAQSINSYKDNVIIRCRRSLTAFDEFAAFGVTFRYADEWDRMTQAEKEIDIAHRKRKKRRVENVPNV